MRPRISVNVIPHFSATDPLITPLQFAEHLNRAFEAGFRTGQKPVTAEIVTATLAPDFDDLEPRLTRQGYSSKVLADRRRPNPRTG